MVDVPLNQSKAKQTSLPFYLIIVGWRIDGFIPFRSEFGLNEMQTASSRFRTPVVKYLSKADNRYTIPLMYVCMYVCICVCMRAL